MFPLGGGGTVYWILGAFWATEIAHFHKIIFMPKKTISCAVARDIVGGAEELRFFVTKDDTEMDLSKRVVLDANKFMEWQHLTSR